MRRPAVLVPGDFTEFAIDEIEQSIPDRFERQVALFGDRLAIKTQTSELTYAELGEAAHRIACAVHERLGPGSEPVALLLPQGWKPAAAILGVLAAGKIYVPLDPSYPPARLRTMLAAAGARLVLTDADTAAQARLASADAAEVLDLDDLSGAAGGKPGAHVPPDAVAYIFFTSGTTGEPKGVFDSHRNVLHNILRYTNALAISRSDRLTLLQSCAFSGSVSSLFCALLNGATSYPFSLAEQGAARLADWLVQERITMFHSVPSIFRSFLDGTRRFHDLRVVRLEGDRASSRDVELFRSHFQPGTVLANGLGTTETGLCRQLLVDHDSAIPDGILPVGFPVRDMEAVLLDVHGAPVTAGEVGEIAVRSRYLALGYWRRPDLTEAAFRPGPAGSQERIYRTGDLGRLREDGCLEYLARKDFQLKIRGHRVEPAEIETALMRIPGVREAVAATVESAGGDPKLVAYVVPERALPDRETMRRTLAEALPGHLVPTAFVELDALPLNENGKVDRRALPAPAASRSTDGAAPRNPLETQLARIWEGVLDVDSVRIDERFLDLGGDSLSAAILVAQVETETGRRMTPSMLLESSTVRELATALDRAPDPLTDVLVAMQPRGTRPPLFCVHGHSGGVLVFAALSGQLGDDQPVYGVQSPGLLHASRQPASIEDAAAHYLRAIRTVQPQGPYHLTGLCFGAVVAFEIAQQLAAQGEDVALLALLGVGPLEFPRLLSAPARRQYARLLRGGELAFRVRRNVLLSRDLPLLQRAAHLARRSARLAPFVWRRARGELAHSPADRRRRAVEAASRRASHSYVARPYPGRAVLCLSEEATSLYSRDPAYDWSGLAVGDVDVRVFPGNDEALLSEPIVAEVAHQLADLIAGGG